MKIEKRKISIILILALFTISLTIVNAVPGIPHKFYGEAYIDGVPAPYGTLVEAKIDGVTYAATTTVSGYYGVVSIFTVPADDPDIIGKDGGENGDIIDFYVDGVWASDFTFLEGEVTELNLYALNVIEYDIDLFEGWNLIGLPFAPEDPSIEVVLADVLENLNSVWTCDGETKLWSSYSPGAPSDLAEMVEDKGYWISMKTNDVLTVIGSGSSGVIRVHPLNGMNIRIGMTSANSSQYMNTLILADDILEPMINEYVSGLGYDITFEFLVKDNQGQEYKAIQNTQHFKSIGIDLVIGHGWSGQCAASLPYVNENDMLLLSQSSTSPTLAIKNDRLFRTCPNDQVQAPAIAEMWETWGAEAVLIFHRADSWGDGIYNILTDELADRGIDELGQIRYPDETENFYSYLEVVNDIITDAIATYGADRVGIQFICFAELRTIQNEAVFYPNLIDVIWMTTENGGRSEQMLDEAGEWATQTRHFSSTMAVDEASFLYQEFEDLYYDLTGFMPDFYAATQYDAAWLLVETILKTASTDPGVIAEFLIPTSYMMHGVSGWMALDENGDRIPQTFDIWGLYEDPITHEYTFGKFGKYDAPAIEVYWYDAFLEYTGITRPGKP